ncbi:MAG UNVERIFIED_CONTAM: hypothetical protein LVR29_10870 [Microcystis novacekii LVE1205-3]
MAELWGLGNSVAVDPFPAILGGATQDKDVGMGGGGVEAGGGQSGGWKQPPLAHRVGVGVGVAEVGR